MAGDVAIGSVPTTPAPALPRAGTAAPAATPQPTPNPAPSSPKQPKDAQQVPDTTGQGGYAKASGGFNLQFADDSPRFFLEARDPATGAIIVQVPAQFAAKGFQAAGRQSSRGSKLDGSF